MRRVALGCRAKTGRAICVALAASGGAAPELVWRGEIALFDPAEPDTGQPYHAVMELPWPRAVTAVEPLVARIEAVARAAVASLVEELRVNAVGVVGSADRPLEKIGSPHMRAHAAEGVLFRRVIEAAARHHRLRCRGFAEKELPGVAAAELGEGVAEHLRALGRAAGPPWRTDERAAATAAWLAL